MPRAQNMIAKGSILKEDEILCRSGYIIYLWSPTTCVYILEVLKWTPGFYNDAIIKFCFHNRLLKASHFGLYCENYLARMSRDV